MIETLATKARDIVIDKRLLKKREVEQVMQVVRGDWRPVKVDYRPQPST